MALTTDDSVQRSPLHAASISQFIKPIESWPSAECECGHIIVDEYSRGTCHGTEKHGGYIDSEASQ